MDAPATRSSVPSFRRRESSSGEAEIKRTSRLSMAPSMTLRSTHRPRGLLPCALRKARGGRSRGMPISSRSAPKAGTACSSAHKSRQSRIPVPVFRMPDIRCLPPRAAAGARRRNICLCKDMTPPAVLVAQENEGDKREKCAEYRSIVEKTHGTSHSFK